MHLQCLQSQKKQRRIFIDGGANRGDTFFLLLNNNTFFPSFVMRRDIDVYLFEASPVWSEDLQRYYSQYPQIKGVYTETALWNNSHETLSFWVNSNHEASSAFFEMKNSRQITVRCIEICEWMISIMGFTVDDYIILKLDVEGAEYTILRTVLQNKRCIGLFDEMYVEWHAWMMRTESVEMVTETLGPDHGYEKGLEAWRALGRNWTAQFRNAGVKMDKWM